MGEKRMFSDEISRVVWNLSEGQRKKLCRMQQVENGSLSPFVELWEKTEELILDGWRKESYLGRSNPQIFKKAVSALLHVVICGLNLTSRLMLSGMWGKGAGGDLNLPKVLWRQDAFQSLLRSLVALKSAVPLKWVQLVHFLLRTCPFSSGCVML